MRLLHFKWTECYGSKNLKTVPLTDQRLFVLRIIQNQSHLMRKIAPHNFLSLLENFVGTLPVRKHEIIRSNVLK